jgi:hypothetical protein
MIGLVIPLELWEDASEDTEALLEDWLVAVGDRVATGQPLATAVIVKTSVELVAPADGVIEAILVSAGETFARGTARRTGNVNLSYVRQGLDLRLFQNFRGDYLSGVGARPALDVYLDAFDAPASVRDDEAAFVEFARRLDERDGARLALRACVRGRPGGDRDRKDRAGGRGGVTG